MEVKRKCFQLILFSLRVSWCLQHSSWKTFNKKKTHLQDDTEHIPKSRQYRNLHAWQNKHETENLTVVKPKTLKGLTSVPEFYLLPDSEMLQNCKSYTRKAFGGQTTSVSNLLASSCTRSAATGRRPWRPHRHRGSPSASEPSWTPSWALCEGEKKSSEEVELKVFNLTGDHVKEACETERGRQVRRGGGSKKLQVRLKETGGEKFLWRGASREVMKWHILF